MGNDQKPPENWRDYVDGSAQACMAEMSVTTLNRLVTVLQNTPNSTAMTDFQMGINTESATDEILVEVVVCITYRRKPTHDPSLN